MLLLPAEGEGLQVAVFLRGSVLHRGTQEVSSQALIVIVYFSAVLEDVGRDRNHQQGQEELQGP